MRKRLFEGLMAFICGMAICQTAQADEMLWELTRQIHPHMIPFTFQLWTPSEARSQPLAYLSILTSEGHEIQRIDKLSIEQRHEYLQFVDLNFDGMLDFYLSSSQQPQQYWIYDKESAKFIINKALSELHQPVFIQNEKYIYSKWQDENSKTTDYYQFVDDALILRKQEIVQCDALHQCEKILFVNKDGILTEINREPLENSNAPTDHYLNHLINRKGLCLASIHDSMLQGDKLSGIKEASLCLNTLVYELVPNISSINKVNEASITLQLRDFLGQHIQLIKSLTNCHDSQDCEAYKEEVSLTESINLADSLIQKMVLMIVSGDDPLQNKNWIAKWEGMNDIMQG